MCSAYPRERDKTGQCEYTQCFALIMPQSKPARHSITFILEIRLKRVFRGLSTRYCSEMLFGITILKRTLFVRVPFHMLHITNNSIKPNNNILVTYSIHQLTPLHLWHSPLDEPNEPLYRFCVATHLRPYGCD